MLYALTEIQMFAYMDDHHRSPNNQYKSILGSKTVFRCDARAGLLDLTTHLGEKTIKMGTLQFTYSILS